MKIVFFTVVLFSATFSFAKNSGNVEYIFEKSDYYLGGFAKVDYDKEELTFHGQGATQLEHFVLPITSVVDGVCGIRTITAKRDLRPRDGDSKEVVIIDTAKFHCTRLLQKTSAVFTTLFNDRKTQKSGKLERRIPLRVMRFQTEYAIRTGGTG